MTEQDLLIQNLKRELKELKAKKVGRWKKNSDTPTFIGIHTLYYYDCSACGNTISNWYGLYPFCPYCGAQMEET